ncbi:MAG: hypothetical protein COZ18_13925 [Flexibacter sp. CG_4_10_14_3_um_filter_32_15]|nr:MAG: hypothetical protein COZ18_13925 [Flexibacter sp. CG_4_10_14_3_um_filter_32_15]
MVVVIQNLLLIFYVNITITTLSVIFQKLKLLSNYLDAVWEILKINLVYFYIFRFNFIQNSFCCLTKHTLKKIQP